MTTAGHVLDFLAVLIITWYVCALVRAATEACKAVAKFLNGPAINIVDNRKYTFIPPPEDVQ